MKCSQKTDPQLDEWEKKGDFPGEGLYYQTSCANEGQVLVGSGRGKDGFAFKDFWIGQWR